MRLVRPAQWSLESVSYLIAPMQQSCPCIVAAVNAAAPGVAVSVSGVGERIMAASLARSVAMALQVQDQEQEQEGEATHRSSSGGSCGGGPPTQAAQDVLQGQLLSQAGPWDAGLVAVRVGCGSGGAGAGSSTSSSSGTSDSSEGGVEGAGCSQHIIDGAAPSTAAAACAAPSSSPPVVRVEFVAAFTAPSFAVGYLAHTGDGGVVSEVQVLRANHQQHSYNTSKDCAYGTDAGTVVVIAPPSSDMTCVPPPGVSCMEVCCSWPLQPATA